MRTPRFTLAILFICSSVAMAQDAFRTIELEVVNASGEPLRNATIDVSTADMDFPLAVNNEGIATLNLPRDAAHLTLKAYCPGHVPLQIRWSPQNTPSNFMFKMSRGEPIGGIVHDERGQPIEGVEIEGLLVSSRAAEEGAVLPEVGGMLGTTDPQGHWRAEVATAEPLELRLKLTHEKFFSDLSFGKRRVSNDELRSLKHVEVLDDRVAPQGIVVDAEGKPAANVSLYVLDGVEPLVLETGRPADKSRRPNARSNADGKYEFPEAEGTFAVLCLADAGWAMVPGKRYDKNKPVDVTLTAWSRVHGVLTEGDKPCPSEDLQLLVHDSELLGGNKYTEWNNYASTNDKGEFQFERLTDGLATIGRRVEYCGGTEHKRQDFSHEFQTSLAEGSDAKLSCVRNGIAVTGTVVPLRYDETEATIACGKIVLTKEDEPGDMVQKFFFEWGKAATVGMNFDPVENRARLGVRPQSSYLGRVEPDGSFLVDDVPPGSYRARVSLFCEGQPDAEFEGDRKGGWHEGSIWEPFAVKPEGDKRTVKLGLLEFKVYSSEE